MGEVYEAIESQTNRRVALKVIQQKTDKNEEILRFLNEAQALGQVTHANVVTMFNVGQHDGFHFIAMEFVEGISLRDLVNQFVLSAKEATSLATQLLKGLSALHQQNIIHRDLSPRNIIIRPNGMLKIIDLGIAKQIGQQQDVTATGVIIGTVSYMAPEIIYGLPATVRTDLWAAGAILFEATSGQALTSSHASLNAQEYPVESQGWVPVPFRKFVAKLCASKPEERFASGQEAVLELSKIFAGGAEDSLLALATLTRKIDDLEGLKTRVTQAGLTGVLAKRAMALAALMSQKRAYPVAAGNPDMTEVLKLDNTIRIEVPTLQAAIAQVRPSARPVVPVREDSFVPPTPPARRINFASLLALFLLIGAVYFLIPKTSKSTSAAQQAAPQVPATPSPEIKVTSPETFWLKKGEFPTLTWQPALPRPLNLQISSTPDFHSSQTWRVQGESTPATPAIHDGQYYWRLTDETTTVGPFKFTVQTVKPLALTAPIDGYSVLLDPGATKEKVNFSWECQPQATLYRVQIGRDTEFRQLFAESQSRTCEWKDIEIPEGRFYWRARVDAPAQFQIWSEVRELVLAPSRIQKLAEPSPRRSDVLANIGADESSGSEDREPASTALKPTPVASPLRLDSPSPLSPTDGGTITLLRGSPVTIDWKPVAGASSYLVEFSADPDFTTPVRRRVDTPNVGFRPKWLESKQIYWRVRAEGKDSRSDWSSRRSFTLPR